MKIAPEIAVGDGALGFWRALEEIFPGTRHQRCWVHKTANVLNKVALSVQANMKKDLREVYLAPSRASAEVAIDVFAEKYAAKHGKAVECLRGHRSGRSRDRKYDPHAARHLFTRGRHSDESECPLHGVYLSRRP